MATLEENLLTLEQTKDNFKSKFANKSISTSGVEFTNYPNLLNGMEKTLPTQTKTVSPTTTEQDVTPDSGYKLAKVTVNAVQTEEKTVKSTETEHTINPTTGKFISKVTVQPIVAQIKNIEPTTSNQQITADIGYDFLKQVNIGAVTSEIDENIVAGNIKKDVEILGITGTLESGGGTEINNQDKTITENGVYTADSGYTGLGTITVNVEGGGGGGGEDIDYLKYEDLLSHIAYGTPLTSDTQYEDYILPTAYKLLDKILLGVLL